MNNAEWMTKNGIPLKKIKWEPCQDLAYESIGYYDTYGNFNECYRGKSLGNSISETILTWLDMEHNEPILTDAEREYLRIVFKPFAKRIKYVRKVEKFDTYGRYYIFVNLDDDDTMGFPSFNGKEMYKGMRLDKQYTLEDLGITYDN